MCLSDAERGKRSLWWEHPLSSPHHVDQRTSTCQSHYSVNQNKWALSSTEYCSTYFWILWWIEATESCQCWDLNEEEELQFKSSIRIESRLSQCQLFSQIGRGSKSSCGHIWDSFHIDTDRWEDLLSDDAWLWKNIWACLFCSLKCCWGTTSFPKQWGYFHCGWRERKGEAHIFPPSMF